MKEARYFYVPNALNVDELPNDEAMHAVRVLRMSEGDEMFLIDGQGMFHRAIITMAVNHHCRYAIAESKAQTKSWSGHIHLAIAPTKMMERMEWMVEKAVEIGIDEISFLRCRNSERCILKTPRLEKIAIAAMKQSRKPFATRINEIQDLSDFIHSQKDNYLYIAHCYDEISRQYLPNHLKDLPQESSVTMMIGPEGDFSIDEVNQAMAVGATSISLGESRLRTETAGLMAVVMAGLRFRKE